MTDISVIIVSFNTKEFLENCLRSIKMYTKGISYEVIVVDNGSSDSTIEKLKNKQSLTSLKSLKLKTTSENVKLIFNKNNIGFARANNQGIKEAKGRYVLLLNQDTQLVENSLLKMIEWIDKHQEVGIVSCKLINTDKSTQATGGSFPTLGRVFLWASFLDDLPFVGSIFGSYHPHADRYFDNEHEQDWVTGAFMLIKRKVLDGVGYLDEDYFMYGEDVEYCLRAKKDGWQVWYTSTTQIIHFGSRMTERSIFGEFTALPKIYQKHFVSWQYPFLLFLLKLGAFLRIIFFGIRLKKEEVKAYVQALAVS